MISNYFRISSLLYLTVVLLQVIIPLYGINASIIETIPTTLPTSHKIIDNHPTTTTKIVHCCKYQYLKHHHGGRNERNQLPTTQPILATSHNITNNTTKNSNQHHISRNIRLSSWGSIVGRGSSRGNGGGDGDNNSGSKRFSFHNLSTADKVWNILYWILIAFVGCFILCLIVQICSGVCVHEEH